jgi:hypothetical protein
VGLVCGCVRLIQTRVGRAQFAFEPRYHNGSSLIWPQPWRRLEKLASFLGYLRQYLSFLKFSEFLRIWKSAECFNVLARVYEVSGWCRRLTPCLVNPSGTAMRNLKSKHFVVRIGKARYPGPVIEAVQQKTPADMFEYGAEAVTFYVETFSNFPLLDIYVWSIFSIYIIPHTSENSLSHPRHLLNSRPRLNMITSQIMSLDERTAQHCQARNTSVKNPHISHGPSISPSDCLSLSRIPNCVAQHNIRRRPALRQ